MSLRKSSRNNVYMNYRREWQEVIGARHEEHQDNDILDQQEDFEPDHADCGLVEVDGCRLDNDTIDSLSTATTTTTAFGRSSSMERPAWTQAGTRTHTFSAFWEAAITSKTTAGQQKQKDKSNSKHRRRSTQMVPAVATNQESKKNNSNSIVIDSSHHGSYVVDLAETNPSSSSPSFFHRHLAATEPILVLYTSVLGPCLRGSIIVKAPKAQMAALVAFSLDGILENISAVPIVFLGTTDNNNNTPLALQQKQQWMETVQRQMTEVCLSLGAATDNENAATSSTPSAAAETASYQILCDQLLALEPQWSERLEEAVAASPLVSSDFVDNNVKPEKTIATS